jgi:hypothetical protein
MTYVPTPDLSGYDTSAPAAGEWMLSDHPWAETERARRAGAAEGVEFGLGLRLVDLGRNLPEHVPVGEEDTVAQWLNAVFVQLNVIEANRIVSDAAGGGDLDTARRHWEAVRRDAGEADYVFPARLLGPGAADVPPPGYLASALAPRQRLPHEIAYPIENLGAFERHRVAFITAAIPIAVDGATVAEVGGYRPVQVTGTWRNRPWLYHHEHPVASLSVGGDPFDAPEFETETATEGDLLPYPGTAAATVHLMTELFAQVRTQMPAD